MIGIFLFLGIIYFLIFILGQLLEWLKIPWIFSALLIGVGLAAYNPFAAITSSSAFANLADLGMYFLLFIIGFEIDIKEIMKQGKFIFNTTIALVVSAAICGAILIYAVFHTSWATAIIVALSFATIGEAALLPILDEFKLLHSEMGQVTLGVGVADDLFEVLAITLAIIAIGAKAGHDYSSIIAMIATLGVMFLLSVGLSKSRGMIKQIKFYGAGSFFLFVLSFIFLFIGIGGLIEGAAALGAIIAGIALKNFLPPARLKLIDNNIRTIAYGFLSPIFFLSVGLQTEISYLLAYPLLILLVIIVVNVPKLVVAYILARKQFGELNSIIMGISFSVKLSTSIVVLAIMLKIGLISSKLYSVLIGSQIVLQFVIPILLAYLIPKWHITGKPVPAKG